MAILKDLIVHGSSRFLNKIYANELEVSAFEAESAIIKKLTAKDATLENATVIGLLDVQGQLHTNTWTNSNIATIDGCFYITPTLSSDSGKISFSSTSVASLTGTYTAVTSLYIGDSSSGSTVQWTKDSKVLLTGEVQVNGQWLPLGTLLGTLSANATTSSIGLTGLTDNRHNTSSIITDIRNAVSNTSLNYRNLKISLYQRRDGTDSKPLGIYMTAMGANGKTFIDIYGGVNATTTAGSSGGFADPNLRIGNLSGLGAVEGTTPTGWGIYTTNGYFKGVIVSSAGKIGNFTINSALYSNNHSAWNSNVSGIYINNDGISGGAGGKWWLWNDGSAKIGAMTLSAAGVLTVPAANVSGKLTAATIDGTQITANTITADQIAAGAIKTDELDANAVTSAKIKAGEVKATNIASSAVTADKLDATTINASNKLTVGALTTTDQNNILNSKLKIGGRNLLRFTAKPAYTGNINTGWSTWGGTVTATDEGIKVSNSSSIASFRVPLIYQNAVVGGEEVTLSFEYRTNLTTTAITVYLICTSGSNKTATITLPAVSTTEWNECNATITFSSTEGQTTDSILVPYQTGWFEIKNATLKLEKGNKVTSWTPAVEDVQTEIDDAAKTATTYITDIDSNKGITIKPADTSGNDYLQMNSSAINFYRNNVETLKIEDSAIRVGKLGNNLRNVYITDSSVQIRNNTSVLAEYGSSIKLYNPTTTTVAVEISSTGASFTGNVKATSLSTGNKTASTTGKGIYIDNNGNIYAGDGSSNNFTVTSEGAMTAKSGTIGKYIITSTYLYTGTGSTQAGIGGNQAFWAGGTDSNSAPFRVSYSGVLNATGATISGNITATSGTIGGASISEDGVLLIKDANISGKISASHIDVSSITIGSLSGADNYALKDDVPTTVAQLTDSGSYLTTSVASNTYATQTNLNNEINARKAVYGTSSTDAGTATKVVTCSNFALYTGASVTVTFSKANTSSAPQLNINSTGAKPIKSYTGANLTEGEYKWVAGASITFTYDGTNWRMQDGGALQAKIDAASSASTASSQAGVATQQATNATNAKTAAESAKTAAESAKTAAQSAKTAAETAQGAAETASSQASSAKDAAVSAKTAAETAKGQAQTAAGNASQSATNAANSATAAAEVMGGFTILWNYSAFGTSNNGRGYLCAFDPATGTKSDANGWVKWNGTKRTITKQLINPSAISPFNIPIYLVCRLSSSTATTGTNYMVWYNSGWKSATLSSPSTINSSWTWADSTDIILGKFVETASGAALTEYEIYNPPYASKQITTNVVTAQSASASAASAAQTATKYITKIDNTGIKIQSYNDTNNTADVNNYIQLNTDGLEIFKDGNSVAMYGDAARIGKESGNNVLIDNDKVSFYSGTIQLAEFDSDAIKFYDGNGNADSHVVVQLGTDGVLLGKEQESNIRIVNNGLIGCESHGTETFNLQQLDTATTEKVYFVRGYFGTDFITAQHLFIGRDYAGTSQSFTVPPTCNSGSDIILRFHVLCRYRNSSNALTDYDCGYYNITFVQGQATAGYPFYIVATDLADYTGGVCGRLTCRYDGENTIDIRVSASATSDESRQQELKIQAYAAYSQFMIFDTEMYPPTFSFGTRVGDLSNYSATIGHSLIATQDDQVVVGKFNKEDTNDEYAFIVGNGADDNNRSNALTVDWSGNLIASGGAAFNNNVSITGSLDITGSITQNNKSLFKKEDVTVTVTYAAGTIGSRGGAISLGTTSKSGYTYLGAYILNNQNTSVFSTIISRNEDTGGAILLVYRATGNAVSNATVKVRKIWVLDSFVTT